MRAGTHMIGCAAFLAAAAVSQCCLVRGQDKIPPLPRGAAEDRSDFPDLSQLPPLQRTLYLSARRGAEWLWQANRADGLFIPGQLPALNQTTEEDSFVRQAGAAGALALAARFTGIKRYEMRAKQAALALLAGTKTDPDDSGGRFPVAPATAAGRLAVAGLMVLCIHELPEPGGDLLDPADELCRFIQRQQQDDGALAMQGEPEEEQLAAAGQALLGLVQSAIARPSPAKLETACKALPRYRSRWLNCREPAAAAQLTSAFAAAYLRTKDKAFADAVIEMADWLCTLQIAFNPKHREWQGGFGGCRNGRAVPQRPGIESAQIALALADACAAVRLAGDVERQARYREAVERGLEFVATLQYTPANTRHFAEWYGPQLYGAFFASPVDGNTRLDYAQYGVSAMLRYLDKVAESPVRKK